MSTQAQRAMCIKIAHDIGGRYTDFADLVRAAKKIEAYIIDGKIDEPGAQPAYIAGRDGAPIYPARKAGLA